MNIPIYRAKKIGSDEWVKGYYNQGFNDKSDNILDKNDMHKIDPSTLAIHFPDMLDKNGKKIFASLSEDGVGGDIVKSIYKDNIIAIWNGYPCFKMEYKKLTSKYDKEFGELSSNEIKVIGIHKG